jgi:hypothetical protein
MVDSADAFASSEDPEMSPEDRQIVDRAVSEVIEQAREEMSFVLLRHLEHRESVDAQLRDAIARMDAREHNLCVNARIRIVLAKN